MIRFDTIYAKYATLRDVCIEGDNPSLGVLALPDGWWGYRLMKRRKI
jgi:hypothetical protein